MSFTVPQSHFVRNGTTYLKIVTKKKNKTPMYSVKLVFAYWINDIKITIIPFDFSKVFCFIY